MGRVLGAHGIRGALRLHSAADPPEGLLDYAEWWLLRPPAAPRRVRPLAGELATTGLLVQLEGIADRDAAEALKGAEVAVDRALLPPLPDGQYYWADLEGLAVLTLDGVALGRIAHLVDYGAHPLMVIRDGVRERLVPFVTGHPVVAVDLAAGFVRVDWDPEF
jgi:16S rRNA processing protein RimM